MLCECEGKCVCTQNWILKQQGYRRIHAQCHSQNRQKAKLKFFEQKVVIGILAKVKLKGDNDNSNA